VQACRERSALCTFTSVAMARACLVLVLACLFAATSSAVRIPKRRTSKKLSSNHSNGPDVPEAEGVEKVGAEEVGAVASDTASDTAPSYSLGELKRSCSCGATFRYTYQTFVNDQDGGGCVGGCGGHTFEVNRYGQTIKELLVWTHSEGYIQGIRFTYFDGHIVTKGTSSSTSKRFTFQAGETIRGDFKLSGNGKGTRLGSIGFTTSHDRDFAVGMTAPKRYLFPSGDSFIGGFFGAGGNDIDRLGVLFWKPIKTVRYINMDYPDLRTLPALQGKTLDTRPYCNPFPIGTDPIVVPGHQYTKKVTIGSKSCLEGSGSVQFGSTVSVEGEIPTVAKTTAETSWSVEASVRKENCQDTTEEVTHTIVFPTITVQPQTSLEWVHTHFEGKLTSLPFTATLEVVVNDGTVYTRKESGTYEGLDMNEFSNYGRNYRTGVTDCR